MRYFCSKWLMRYMYRQQQWPTLDGCRSLAVVEYSQFTKQTTRSYLSQSLVFFVNLEVAVWRYRYVYLITLVTNTILVYQLDYNMLPWYWRDITQRPACWYIKPVPRCDNRAMWRENRLPLYEHSPRWRILKVLEVIFLELKNRKLPAPLHNEIEFNLQNFGIALLPIIFVNFKTSCLRVELLIIREGQSF